MVIFVGNRLRLGGLAAVIENRLGDQIAYIEECASIKDQENDILARGEASYVIYDIDQYFDESEDLIEIIKRIQRANKAKPVLYVKTDNPKNEIIKWAVSKQIKSFVNESMPLGEQKNQLEKILNGYYEANGREDVKLIEKEVEKESKSLNAFVTELYDAKQREEIKENTIIIHKRSSGEVVLSAFANVIKIVFAIVSIILMSIAIITLIYTDTREALFAILSKISDEALILLNLNR